MKIVVFIALIIGLILGPGYLVYCTAFSGSPLKSYIAYEGRVNEGGLSPVRKSEVKWNAPESFSLDPAMNPIKISAEIKYRPMKVLTRKETDYNAKLTTNGNVVWEEDFSLVLRKSKEDKKGKKKSSFITITSLKKKNIPIKTFSVDKSGEYKLDLSLLRDSAIAFSDVKVIIRRNVKIPQKRILIIGFALLVFGLVGGIAVGKKIA